MFSAALMQRDVMAHGVAPIVHEAICIAPAIVGDLPGLRRLAEQMFLGTNAEVELAAALLGHVHILEWTHSQDWTHGARERALRGDEVWDDSRVLHAAVIGRQAAVARWVMQRTPGALGACREGLQLMAQGGGGGDLAWLDAVVAGGAAPAVELASECPNFTQLRAAAAAARAALVAAGHMPPVAA